MNYRFVIFDGFWSEYWWVILVCAVGGGIIGFVIAQLAMRPKRKKAAKVDAGACFSALGGEENIVSKSLQGSRIILTCKNYEAIDREALKKAGVTGFIQSEDKLTLVVKGGASEVYASLFPEAK